MSLELLEGRELMAAYSVTSAADNGNNANPSAGSLRAAIIAANTDGLNGGDTISFAIPGSGVQTIGLVSTLPTITRGSLVIDATTQPGYAAGGPPVVVIDGSGAGAGANGLTISTGGSDVIRGLAIVGFHSASNGFGGEGIYLQGPGGNNLIQGNYVGIGADGSTARGNATGILAFSSGNTIGGTTALARNVISGNTYAGILLADPGATGNLILGDYIGTDASATQPVGNQFGIVVMTSGNTIGGTAAGSGNVISGNVGPNASATAGPSGAGILLEGQAKNNLIQGNKIGTNAAGTSPVVGNGPGYSNVFGIYFGSQSDPGSDNLAQETVGGTVAGAGNLISGNFTGITGNVTSSLIAGNTIGLNLAGTLPLPNGNGIVLGASGTTIGGTTPLARNIVSGNTTISGAAGTGIELSGDSDVVQGNFIGLTAAGLSANGIGNQLGLDLGTLDQSQAPHYLTNSTIGSTVFGASNLISGNATDGIRLQYTGSDGLIGNVIGLDIQGHAAPNVGNGIALTIPAPATTPTVPLQLNDSIGGTALGAGNTIARNGGAGVLINDLYPTGVTGLGIQGNTIFANAGLGIDTRGTGVPVPSTLFINGSGVANGMVTVTGVYFGAPSSRISVDLFANAADPRGYGQGPIYLGTVSTTTNASGFAVFGPSFPSPSTPYTSFSATATGPDGNTSEFSANFPTVAGASQANLVVQASASDNSPVVGDTITLTEKVFNLGPNAAGGAMLFDSLPASMANASVVTSQGTASVDGNNVVSVNFGSLAANSVATVTITVTVSAAGVLVDRPGASSTSYDPNYLDNTASQAINVTQANNGQVADLAIVESASPNPAAIGAPLTYIVTVGNLGPNAATNVTVRDFLPVGTTFGGALPSQGVIQTIVGNLMTVNLGTIAPGATATITIVVTPTAAGPITNSANVNGSGQVDPVTSNNSTTLTTAVSATPSIRLYLAQSATTTTGTAGQLQGFILTFENFGPSTATNVILNDAIPANATYVSSIPSQGGPPTLLANGLLSVNFGTLAPGGIATLQLVLRPKSVGTLTNVAGIFTPDVPSAAPSYASASVSIIAGPSVSGLNGFGNNSQLVIGFNEALDANAALNPANYQLVAMGKSGTVTGKTIKVASVTYNSIAHSVMIVPAQPLDPTQYYKITVFGSTSSGITDTLGRKLAGSLYGTAGGNFSAVFFAGTLPQI